MSPEFVSMWDADGGEAARCYAEKPRGHYKEEVYPIFCEILDSLGDGIRVLDVGAGPGHLAHEFFKKRPESTVRFALMDAGQAMLDIARRRTAELGFEIECFRRSYNLPGWEEGLGRFDAIVSNNSIFNVGPELLAEFYAKLYGLLKENGLLLNQQSFACEHADFGDAVKGFPGALSHRRLLTEDDRARAGELNPRAKELCAAAEARQKEMIEKLRAEGRDVADPAPGYASLHVPASRHIDYMREAGFVAGTIWRKMEFAVLVGFKGRPFGGPSKS